MASLPALDGVQHRFIDLGGGVVIHVAEQRYQAVLAVIGDGLSISQVAEKGGSVAPDAAHLVGPL